ncbi:MAG: DUF1624 domain-containing protein [Chitinophagales bacterium]|nr:DUF1624 domain-containing protein [Chitinophagales bacterium]
MVTSAVNNRIRSVDILRGIVMVIMALDHTRDYFSNFHNNPTNLTVASMGMFLTRWITHYCAPVFVFLAGTSAFLSLSKKNNKKEASLFLLKRGIWLLILEFTVVRFGWMFNMDYTQTVVQVIWAIGWSMIFLSALIYLPFRGILAVGLVMIFGHNLLDMIQTEADTPSGALWYFIHQSGFIQYNGNSSVFVIYPIIPWIGVMATGYCFGSILQQDERTRNKQLYLLGGTTILFFLIIRATKLYGDPAPWEPQENFSRTVLSFINCEKYPPSLLYLLMTLGPAILIMPLLEKMSGAAGRFFIVFGRVPMFYYILHIYLVHAMALVWCVMQGLPADYFTDGNMIFAPKQGWGYELPVVYMVWILAILLLYVPCRWFMYIKLNHKKWWLSYI